MRRLSTCLVAGILGLTLVVSDAVRAAPSPTIRATITAILNEDNRRLSGRVSFTVINDTGDDLETLPVSLYPNHLKTPSDALDGGQVRWIYPRGRSAAGMTIRAATWNGREIPLSSLRYPRPKADEPRKPDTIASITLPSRFAAGSTGNLVLDFDVQIPVRRGRFGTYHHTTILAGGWFPRLLSDLTGVNTQMPPDRIEATVDITLPKKRGAVLHDHIFPVKAGTQTVHADHILTESLVLVVMDRMEKTVRKTAFGEAIHIHQTFPYHHTTWKETTEDHNGLPNALPDPGWLDYSARILDVVENTATLIREAAPKAPLASRVVLVDIPAWDRMVQLGPGPVLVSDRLYRLLTVDDGLFFHDLALVRQVAPTLLLGAIENESPRFRFIAADAIGVYFSDVYSHKIHDKRRTVKEIISFASMFPAVDNILYAPQIPFKEVYFKPVEEPEPLRDEPWYFTNTLPRGKRIVGKLEDLVGKQKTGEAIVAFIEGKGNFETCIAAQIPGDSSFFFKQWFGPYPKVNYRVDNVQDIPLTGGRIEHRFDVIRDGATIREPVTIRLTDKDDMSHELVWDSDKPSQTLSWISTAPIDKVIIDPDGRLVESPELTADHPLSDNRNKLPLRPPMFTRLVVWADVTAKEPYVQLGFWLRRKYDTTNVINLDLDYTPSAYGALLSYYRFFGPKKTLNARTWGLGPSVSVIHYNEVANLNLEVDDATRAAATMGAIGFSIGRDTRVYGWDPISGSSVSLGGSYAAGADASHTFRQVGRVSIHGGKIFAPGIHHTLALYGGATAVFGDPVAAHLTSISDFSMLRGFDSDETYGRVALHAVLEYRHTLVDASSVRAPIFSWFDRFQGALFVGGGTVSDPESLTKGLLTLDRLFTEVGYGVRTHILFLGVQQYIIAVDAAIPITPFDRRMAVLQSDGTIEEKRRIPYKIMVGITQTF